jgi:hypothetical protein
MLKQAYGEDCLTHAQCYEWYRCFKLGRTSIKNDPNSGWASTSMDDHVKKVHVVIHENRHLMVCVVFEEIDISKSLCHTILTKKVERYRVAACNCLHGSPRPWTLAKHETSFCCMHLHTHCSSSLNFLVKHETVIHQLPYSPGLDLANFFCFSGWSPHWTVTDFRQY